MDKLQNGGNRRESDVADDILNSISLIFYEFNHLNKKINMQTGGT